MGFGLPAAIGAQVACPGKTVLALVGDGGFQMSIPELATIANYALPIKIIIVNNGHLGMVRQWQELFHRKRLSAVRLDTFPNITQLGAAYGLRGLTLAKPQDLARGLETALGAPGPCLVNVEVAPFENVYPMVPTGAAIHEMVLGPSAAPVANPNVAPPVRASVATGSAAVLPVTRTIRLRVQKVPGALQRVLGAITVQGCVVCHLTVHPAAGRPGELIVRLTLEGAERPTTRAIERIRKVVNVIEVCEPHHPQAPTPKPALRAARPEPSHTSLEPWQEAIESDANPVEDGVY